VPTNATLLHFPTKSTSRRLPGVSPSKVQVGNPEENYSSHTMIEQLVLLPKPSCPVPLTKRTSPEVLWNLLQVGGGLRATSFIGGGGGTAGG